MRIAKEHPDDTGYQRIGFITVDLDLIQLEQRIKACTECLKTWYYNRDESLILKLGYWYNAAEAINTAVSSEYARPGRAYYFCYQLFGCWDWKVFSN